MTDLTVNVWLDEITKLKEEKAAIENKIKELEDSIKELMGDLQEFETDRYKIKWSKYTQEKFDSKRFKENNAAIYQTYLVKNELRRFSFSKKKGVKAA